uniref:Adipokinetic hormone 1 n=1 Tax=Glossina brevipalpis TaxID=37001 RepID=A0A1A9X5R1_9MUSC
MYTIRTIIAIAFFALILSCVECQLTFSPGWGKRSGVAYDAQSGNCKTSNEMLMEIFRFVQNEAQLFLDCKHRE